MATLLETLRTRLLADAPVAALVGTKVFPLVIPQGEQPPAVVLTVVSDVPATSLTGDPAELLREYRVQVDTYSKRYADAQQLAAAVGLVLGRLAEAELSANRESARDLYDDETQLYRVTADFFVWQ